MRLASRPSPLPGKPAFHDSFCAVQVLIPVGKLGCHFTMVSDRISVARPVVSFKTEQRNTPLQMRLPVVRASPPSEQSGCRGLQVSAESGLHACTFPKAQAGGGGKT